MTRQPTHPGRALLVLACLWGMAGCAGPSTPGSDGDALEANATLERVVDGDTIVVETDGAEERVRLIGINTPESVDPRRPVMCFGEEASSHLTELLPAGAPLRLERDVEARDRYDRLLAYVYRAVDGEFVNLAMVDDGFAEPSPYPPNVAHRSEFSAAASRARQRGCRSVERLRASVRGVAPRCVQPARCRSRRARQPTRCTPLRSTRSPRPPEPASTSWSSTRRSQSVAKARSSA